MLYIYSFGSNLYKQLHSFGFHRDEVIAIPAHEDLCSSGFLQAEL